MMDYLQRLIGPLSVAMTAALAYLLAEAAWPGLQRLWQRRPSRARVPRLPRLPWRAWLAVPATAILAASFWLPAWGNLSFGLPSSERPPVLISVYLLGVGLMSALYLGRRMTETEEERLIRGIGQLVIAFTSALPVHPSLFKALAEAAESTEEPVRSLALRAVNAYYAGGSAARAVDELRRLGNPFLDQLADILEVAHEAERAVLRRVLDELRDRIQAHERLRGEAKSELDGIIGQATLVQAIGLLFVLLVSRTGLRSAYTDTPQGQLVFIGLMSVALAISYWIERKVHSFKERGI